MSIHQWESQEQEGVEEEKKRAHNLIHQSCWKVLFAEASKDFVDFLFHLLSLPLGTVIKLLTNTSMVGQNEQGAADTSVKDEQGGIVKGVVTYMVMDDLVVKPMSTISSITILNKFNIKEVDSLEERIVEIGINEGLKLLNASLESKTILTNVFLGNGSA
ncbi:hypothetical protein RND71_006970 [Anisodus tanguticus]|uniref:Uncharacterized protein n=1 Tax=Anisodus tanguticus TaxID=243964 RepID=A0AAE1SV69_9SOLA|nr:hypothetical protein RND71_006970 [Anisodus tanguticus]